MLVTARDVTLTVQVTLPAADVVSGWGDDLAELGESVVATLQELIGDDGRPYTPRVVVHFEHSTVAGDS